MPPQSEYEKAHMDYRRFVKEAAEGKPGARADKVKASETITQIEREAARAGQILSAQYKGDRVVVSTQEVRSKRSLQEEYIHKFDNETRVKIADRAGEEPKEQTLREFHRKRLLGK